MNSQTAYIDELRVWVVKLHEVKQLPKHAMVIHLKAFLPVLLQLLEDPRNFQGEYIYKLHRRFLDYDLLPNTAEQQKKTKSYHTEWLANFNDYITALR
jgi:hypothetical protein